MGRNALRETSKTTPGLPMSALAIWHKPSFRSVDYYELATTRDSLIEMCVSKTYPLAHLWGATNSATASSERRKPAVHLAPRTRIAVVD